MHGESLLHIPSSAKLSTNFKWPWDFYSYEETGSDIFSMDQAFGYNGLLF